MYRSEVLLINVFSMLHNTVDLSKEASKEAKHRGSVQSVNTLPKRERGRGKGNRITVCSLCFLISSLFAAAGGWGKGGGTGGRRGGS